jgi:tetratricopeptide (TPR) repeat protein/4-amino-4-deoxy-L-arabinose transferase-like glycosyltransferase
MVSIQVLKNHLSGTLVCLLFLVLGILRLNDTSLYTDSTRYVIWGTSFSQGKGLVDNTQPDPERYVVNAPLYSIVLAPVLLVFPFSLAAAKLWTLCIGVCAVALFYVWLFRRLGPTQAFIGALVLASNPLMIVMATEAMSEMCFIALALIAMILWESVEEGQTIQQKNWVFLFIVLSILPILREVSIALTAAVVVVLLVKRNYKHSLWIVAGTGILLGAWLIRNLVIVGTPSTSQSTNVNFIFGHFVTPMGSSLANELIQRAVINIKTFYVFLISLLMYPFPQPLIVDPSSMFRAFFKSISIAKYILPFLILPFFLSGIYREIKQGYKAYVGLLFIIFYLLIIIFYPIQDARFVLPLLPFGIYYVLVSFRSFAQVAFLQNKTLRKVLASLALAIVVVPNLSCDFELARTNWNYQQSPSDLYQKIVQSRANKELFVRPWKKLGDWVSAHLPDSVVIASTYKEASIFIGERKILEINYGVPGPMFERFLRDYGVEYVLSAGEKEYSRPYEFVMEESRRFWFEPIQSISGLALFKVHSSLTESLSNRGIKTFDYVDTVTARGLLHRGRTALFRGDYQKAITDFIVARERGADAALATFQLTIAYAMWGHSDEASAALGKLYSLPQSTSYIPASRLHMQAMQTYLSAQKQADAVQSSVQLFDAAAFYWNFGYQKQAFDVLRETLKKDSAYFVALLWGWDYATELGDNAQARTYLKTLESIDRNNAVVTGMRKITAINEKFLRTTNARKRSELRLETAKVYWDIGLPDESFDYAERSIGEDPNNISALQYLSELFKKTDKPWALLKLNTTVNKFAPVVSAK